MMWTVYSVSRKGGRGRMEAWRATRHAGSLRCGLAGVMPCCAILNFFLVLSS
jgi:hypothetical protein